MDEYCCRCDPHGTRGNGGDATRSGCSGGGLGGVGMNGGANGDGSTRGGDGTLGTTDDGLMGGGGMVTEVGDDDFGK